VRANNLRTVVKRRSSVGIHPRAVDMPARRLEVVLADVLTIGQALNELSAFVTWRPAATSRPVDSCPCLRKHVRLARRQGRVSASRSRRSGGMWTRDSRPWPLGGPSPHEAALPVRTRAASSANGHRHPCGTQDAPTT